jgi:hypothetical protein
MLACRHELQKDKRPFTGEGMSRANQRSQEKK